MKKVDGLSLRIVRIIDIDSVRSIVILRIFICEKARIFRRDGVTTGIVTIII